MSLTFHTYIQYMPTPFNQRFQHEAKYFKIFAALTDDKQKQNRLFMCKDPKDQDIQDRYFSPKSSCSQRYKSS